MQIYSDVKRAYWNETETKLKQNSFKNSSNTVIKLFVSANITAKRFSSFSQSQAGIRCLCETTVYDAVNQTLVNKHGYHMRH